MFRSRTSCYSGRVFNMMIGTIWLFNRKLLCKSGRLFHWKLFCYGGIPFNRTLFCSSEMSFTSTQFKTVIGCSKGSCCASLEGCLFVSRCVSVADCALVNCFLTMVGYSNEDNCFTIIACLVGVCWLVVGVSLIDGRFVEDSSKLSFVLQ